ncbi:MAG: phosphoglucosamine mutase [Bacteroidota bacterium]
MNLKIGPAGVRGLAGETLTPELLIAFAEAFGTYLGPGSVLVGRDTRPSGEMAFAAVAAGLTSVGCSVVDAGVCPIPIVQHALARSGAMVGGIAIAAGHIPAQWNALKFFGGDGTPLNAFQAEELLDIYHRREFKTAAWDQLGTQSTRHDLTGLFLDDLCAHFDVESIRRARLKVAVDCATGTAGPVTAELLGRLGCEVTFLRDKPGHGDPRDAETEWSSVHMASLCQTVRALEADLGFAQDRDADRLAVVTEAGEALPEDYTLLLAAMNILAKERGPIVATVSATRALDDLAARYGCRLHRCRVGEADVVERMRSLGAVIGGDAAGGVVYPPLHHGRDSFAGMALILELVARTGKNPGRLLAEVPRYEIVKASIPCPTDRIGLVLAEIRARYRREELDLTDGVKVTWPDRWVQIRPANTELVLRVVAEASARADALALCDEVRAAAEDAIHASS